MQTIIESQDNTNRPVKKQLFIAALVITALGFVVAALPTTNNQQQLDLEDLQIGTVKTGNLIRDVRAPGNLVAKNRHWLAAQVSAKVIKRVLEPGAVVSPSSIILQLASPDLIQDFKQEQIQFEVVQAQLEALVEIQITEKQRKQATVSLLVIEKKQAIEDAQAKQKMNEKKIIPDYQYNEAVLRQQKLSLELDIARFELKQLPRLQASLLKVEKAKVEQQKLQVILLKEQVALLNVTAGMHGILQSIAVEEGQEVSKGSELARVADQKNLKAELRIQESQAKDIQLGQKVMIDTRRSKIVGLVSRIDPAVLNGTVTVDVSLPENLPSEARPDLRVNGIVEIERLENVLLLDKPANFKTNNNYFFKLNDDLAAVKTKVSLGANSVAKIEVINGLQAGDKVILSDMSSFEQQQSLIISN